MVTSKFKYLGRVTSADIISGLDPQELDRLLLSAKTACPKLDALTNAASFTRNSCMYGRLLAAHGLGVGMCQPVAALPAPAHSRSTRPLGRDLGHVVISGPRVVDGAFFLC